MEESHGIQKGENLKRSGSPESLAGHDLLDAPVFVSRPVHIGGKSSAELRRDLERGGVRLNEAGERLFAHPGFTTAAASCLLRCVEVAVLDLGFSDGATMEAILSSAAEAGLAACPLETGPHLRLHYRDQPEGFVGHPSSRHRAPPGSLTVVSSPLSEDHETPKGFYLRRISGELWLRGYRSGPEHVWSPEDRLLFCREEGLAQPLTPHGR